MAIVRPCVISPFVNTYSTYIAIARRSGYISMKLDTIVIVM